MSRLKIVVIGTSSASGILKCLASLDVDVMRVLAPDRRAGQLKTLHASASRFGFATDSTSRIKDPEFEAEIRDLEIDMILCARSPFLLPESLITAPKLGSFNLHTGPLPEYAGRNVISWAIFNQRPYHGATLHWMAEEIDAGPIAYQRRFEIDDSDTGVSVTQKCMRHSIEMVRELMEQAIDEPSQIPRIQQDFSVRQYFGRETPNDGWIDFSWPAEKAAAFVRACDFFPFKSPWGHPRVRFEGKEYRIMKATLGDPSSNSALGTIARVETDYIDVACADRCLRITEFEDDQERVSVPECMRGGGILVTDAS